MDLLDKKLKELETSSAKAGDVFSGLSGVSDNSLTDVQQQRISEIQQSDIYGESKVGTGLISNDELNKLTARASVEDPDAISNLALQNQSNADKVLSSLNRTIFGELIGGSIEGVGALLDIAAKPFEETAIGMYEAIADEKVERDPYANFITRFGKGIREATNKANPIYRENPDESFDFGDVGYWAEHAPSVISSVSSLFTGMAIGKGTGMAAGKLAGMYGKAQAAGNLGLKTKALGIAAKIGQNKYVQAATGAVGNRLVENYREAADAYHSSLDLSKDAFSKMTADQWDAYLESNEGLANEARQKFGTDKPSTAEMSKLIAEKSADKSMVNNMWNLVWDIPQFTAIGKIMDGFTDAGVPLSRKVLEAQSEALIKAGGKGLTDSAIRNQLAKSYGKRTGLWALGTLSEAPEEMLNEASSRISDQYAKDLITGTGAKSLSVVDAISAYGGDPQLWEAGLWGVIGGMAFGAGAKGLQKAGTAINNAREEKGLSKWFGVSDPEVERKLAISEIKSREDLIQIYANNIKSIEEGINPYTNEPIKDPAEAIKLSADAFDDAIETMANKSVKHGTSDLLYEYLQDENVVKGLAEITGYENQDVANRVIETLDQAVDDYNEAYNSMWFEEDMSGHINDIIIDRYVQRKQMGRRIDEDIKVIDDNVNEMFDSSTGGYNQRLANNNGRQLIDDLRLATLQDIKSSIENSEATTDAQKSEKAIQLQAISNLLESYGDVETINTDKAFKSLADLNMDPNLVVDKTVFEFQKSNIDVMNNRKKSDIIQEADTIVRLIANNVEQQKEKARQIIKDIITASPNKTATRKMLTDIRQQRLDNEADNEALAILRGSMTKRQWEDEIRSIVESHEAKLAQESQAATVVDQNKQVDVIVETGVEPPVEKVVEPQVSDVTADVIKNIITSETPVATTTTITPQQAAEIKQTTTSTTPTNNTVNRTAFTPISKLDVWSNLVNYDIVIMKQDSIKIGTGHAIDATVTKDGNIVTIIFRSDKNSVIKYSDPSNLDSINNLIESGLIALIPNGKSVVQTNTVNTQPSKSFANTSNNTKEAAETLAKGVVTITSGNVYNYTYTMDGISKIGNEPFDTVKVEDDGYGGIEASLLYKGDFVDTYTDDDALEIINKLILSGKLKAEPYIDDSIKASAVLDELFTAEVDMIDNFIKSSLADRGIKVKTKGKTSISLLDLVFHAMDATNDINKALVIKDKLLKGISSFEALQNKYNILESDLNFMSSQSFAGMLMRGKTKHINDLLKENDNQAVNIDINNTLLDQIFTSDKRRANGKYLLSVTDENVLEAINNIVVADKENSTNVYVSKYDNKNNVLIETADGNRVKIGELPVASVDKDGITHSVVKGLNYVINDNNIPVIDQLINDIQSMSDDEFTNMYLDLLDYKRGFAGEATKAVILEYPAVKNVFKHANEKSFSTDKAIEHIANLVTFKDITPTANIKDIAIGLLNNWKTKVISNNNYYKQFNTLADGESVPLKIKSMNKGVLNKVEGTANPLSKSFSESELANAVIGVGRIRELEAYTSYVSAGASNVDVTGVIAGATYLIVRDNNNRELKVNLKNSPLTGGKVSHSAKGNKWRDRVKADLKITVDNFIDQVLSGNVSKEAIDQMYYMLGKESYSANRSFAGNKGGVISGSQLSFAKTDTGFTMIKTMLVDGKYEKVFVGFNYINARGSSVFKSNIALTVGRGKTTYLNIDRTNTAKNALDRFFYIDGKENNNYFQLNVDANKSLSNPAHEYKSISTGETLTWNSYKDYLIDTEAVVSDVVGITDRTGKRTITGFVPNGDMTSSPIKIGNNLSIQLTSDGNKPIKLESPTVAPTNTDTNTTTPINQVDVINNRLKTSNKPSDIIKAVDSESLYGGISSLLDSFGVEVHNEVLPVGTTIGAFKVPDVYGYYQPMTKKIFLTDKLNTTNKDNIIRTIVHETVHGALQQSDVKYEDIAPIYEAARKANDPDINRYLDEFDKYNDNRKYEEFIVEALTSKSFASALAKVPPVEVVAATDSNSLFGNLMNIIRKIINSTNPSLLNDVDRIINSIQTDIQVLVETDNVSDIKVEDVPITNTYEQATLVVDKPIDNNSTIGLEIDTSSDDFDIFSSAIDDQKVITNMDVYKNSLPDYLKSEYDSNVANGNITYICS